MNLLSGDIKIRVKADVTEILRFYDFAHLAGKCLFAPFLASFLGGFFQFFQFQFFYRDTAGMAEC